MANKKNAVPANNAQAKTTTGLASSAPENGASCPPHSNGTKISALVYPEEMREQCLETAQEMAYEQYGNTLPYILIERVAEEAMGETLGSAQYPVVVDQRLFTVVLQYEKLQERVEAAAKQAFPAEYVADSLNEDLVACTLDEVITQHVELIFPVHPHLDLDPFTDVIWPATKLRLAAALGTTVSIDATRLETWLRDNEPAGAKRA